jgi:quercetin dioxygenase-like cupin family protein
MPSVRADFTVPAWLAPHDFEWVSSPQGGVERVMLDREGDEVATATSLVRYAPGSRFPAHDHARGEEFLVLQGEFGDQHGRYGPGTYVRNPPGSHHAPFAEPGCLIWVKLRQFHPEDLRHRVIDLRLSLPARGTVSKELHRFRTEVVTSIAAAPGARLALPAAEDVQELFVIDGAVQWRDLVFERHGWLRVPAGEAIEVRVLAAASLLHKTRPAFALPEAGATGATSSASAGM